MLLICLRIVWTATMPQSGATSEHVCVPHQSSAERTWQRFDTVIMFSCLMPCNSSLTEPRHNRIHMGLLETARSGPQIDGTRKGPSARLHQTSISVMPAAHPQSIHWPPDAYFTQKSKHFLKLTSFNVMGWSQRATTKLCLQSKVEKRTWVLNLYNSSNK